MPTLLRVDDFPRLLLNWFSRHGRHDLPWQKRITPYRAWVSEIMLQQTQVNTVIPYFKRFIKRFPDINTLAAADLDEVLHLWTGLGYYARARNLHRAARMIMEKHSGKFPEGIDDVLALPGIGRSTAGAILSLACGQRHPILDGNVKRVLARYHTIKGWPGHPAVAECLWEFAEQHTPHTRVAEYTQAIMDLGATLCSRRNPECTQCPVENGCQARKESRTHEFPQARPRKTLPVRQTVFTILQNHRGEILLHQRPPSGLWGGLWTFPECKPGVDIKSWLQQQWGYTVETLAYKMPLRHTFSHFHLDITPVHIRVNGQKPVIHDTDHYHWYRPGGSRNLGLAAPVLKLLSDITEHKMESF